MLRYVFFFFFSVSEFPKQILTLNLWGFGAEKVEVKNVVVSTMTSFVGTPDSNVTNSSGIDESWEPRAEEIPYASCVQIFQKQKSLSLNPKNFDSTYNQSLTWNDRFVNVLFNDINMHFCKWFGLQCTGGWSWCSWSFQIIDWLDVGRFDWQAVVFASFRKRLPGVGTAAGNPIQSLETHLFPCCLARASKISCCDDLQKGWART